MLSQAEWIGVVSAIVVATVAVLGFVLRLMGSPTPLSPTNMRQLGAKIRSSAARLRSIPSRQRAAREQREQERSEAVMRQRAATARCQLHSAVLRICDIRGRPDSYYPSEIETQTLLCKDSAIEFAMLTGTQISHSQHRGDGRPLNFVDGGLAISFGAERSEPNHLAVIVTWYPDRRLSGMYGFDPELREHRKTIVNEAFNEDDMAKTGWEVPREWVEL